MQLEGHLVEHIPPPHNAWSMRTYRAQYIFETSCYPVLYRFWPYLSMVKNHLKKILVVGSRSGSGSSPKSNQFVLVTQNFIRIRPQHFEIPCTQTDKQTNRKTDRETERGETITSFTFVAEVMMVRLEIAQMGNKGEAIDLKWAQSTCDSSTVWPIFLLTNTK